MSYSSLCFDIPTANANVFLTLCESSLGLPLMFCAQCPVGRQRLSCTTDCTTDTHRTEHISVKRQRVGQGVLFFLLLLFFNSQSVPTISLAWRCFLTVDVNNWPNVWSVKLHKVKTFLWIACTSNPSLLILSNTNVKNGKGHCCKGKG